jgi:CheY-like chemotaxis protein
LSRSAGTLGLFDIGGRNVRVAETLLAHHGIRILRDETGGGSGRKIYMDTATNVIAVEAIRRSGENVERDQKLEELKGRRIRVLVVDDSRTVRTILRRGIELADDMAVVGEAVSPYEAKEKILELDPDVMCLDIIMPRMDGITFLWKVMRYKYLPTVIVSTIAKRGTEMGRRARRAEPSPSNGCWSEVRRGLDRWSRRNRNLSQMAWGCKRNSRGRAIHCPATGRYRRQHRTAQGWDL